MRESANGLGLLLFLLLWIGAVAPAVNLGDVSWPYDLDGFRDVAIAQAIGDNAWTSDPLYKGEVAWYSPLIPAIVWLTSVAGDLTMPRAHVATGLWLNAFIPPAFFVCARRLLGTWPALAATCAFLFLPGRAPAWASAPYSPWLFPSIATQVPFYVTVWAWANALERTHVLRMAGCGVLLGLTFLAHSAAGIVLGGIMLLTSWVYTTPLRKPRVVALARAATPFFVAAVVVAPFLVPIAVRYRFDVVNREPATWVYDAAHPIAVIAGAARPSALVNLAVLGIGTLWAYRRLEPIPRGVLTAWALVAASGLSYSLLAEQWPRLPTVVPAYHFLFLLRALKWLLFGCGIIALADAVAPFFSRRGMPRVTPRIVRASLVLLLAAAIYPRYLGREAFVAAPAVARSVSQDDREAYRWIRSHTDSSAVFLSSDVDALRVVGAAGRAVVSVHPFFSKPLRGVRTARGGRAGNVRGVDGRRPIEIRAASPTVRGVAHTGARRAGPSHPRSQREFPAAGLHFRIDRRLLGSKLWNSLGIRRR